MKDRLEPLTTLVADNPIQREQVPLLESELRRRF